MSSRTVAAIVGLVGVSVFVFVRPETAAAGSDCEVLSSGLLREPVATVSSLAIVAAGWVIARHRTAPGIALVVAGAASIAAHATAHPTARALDGILATIALAMVAWSILSDRPDGRRLATGLGIGSIAVTIWLLTRTGAALCDTAGPWGHATWHLLVAVAAVAAFLPSRAAVDR